MHALVVEAMKKAPIAWVTVGERTPCAVWCLWVDDALYVVSGPGEQPAPGLAGAVSAMVTARGDHGGRVITWPARVERLQPGTDLWADVVPKLAGKRLNSSGAEDLERLWAAECTVSRLIPADNPTEAGPTLPDSSLVAPPPPSPAVRTTRKPFRLHRVARPRG